ncbi:hypothetical protein [Marixanthomonas spongiae]|uniref:MetA-pathway of phenol degradation n=1 Tax=Marixanthomonas spongiae TaxID=2174845 RepID=A0A2U0HXC5_9FLAO|nr:hypothetical protein [Marixanthomonas spongiae]PVW13390.1 hypothetical protein DDV96_13570 [Marixanthomonas spongiae]
MKTVSLVFFLSCILLCVSQQVFSQGKIDGFYRGSGHATVTLGTGFEDNNNYLAGTDETDISRKLYYVNLFAAYGITENLDIQAALPYIEVDDNNNVQDISVFLKYRGYKKNFAASKLELSIATGFSTNVSNYNVGGLNDIGQQAIIIDIRAIAHYQTNAGWFASLQSGFSFKLEEVPNSLPITFKAGRALTNWYYDVYYDYQQSFGGIDYLETPPPQNFKRFGVNYHKIGGTGYRSFTDNFGAYASISYVFGGRNVFQGPGYGIGFVADF